MRTAVATAAVAVAGAAAVGGVAFGVGLALAQPPASTKVGAKLMQGIRQNRLVYSAGWLSGRRVGSVCKTIGTERYSQIVLADGRQGIANWRAGRMFHLKPHHLGELRNEVLLAGCSGQLDRFVSRQLRYAVNDGRPLRLAPAIFGGKRVYRLRIDQKPRLTYLFVDPERLVPVGIALRTPHVSGTSALDVVPWRHASHHRRWIH